MSVERCAVPNCVNTATTGIPFPKQTELLAKWLDSLKMSDFVPKARSFVCLEHFGEGDILDRFLVSDLQNVLEELPVPVIINKSEVCTKFEQKNEDSEFPELSSYKSEAVETPEDSFTQSIICRLCTCDEADKNIFETHEGLLISDIITTCIPQITISECDHLSKWICSKCLEILLQFYKFRNACIEHDKNQRQVKRSVKRKQKQSLNVKRVCLERSDLDKKFDQVEAELMRALEEQIPEEMRSADNIIIQVQSDDEDDTENVVRVGSDEIALPKGIKISLNQTPVQVCSAQSVQDIDNSEFCLVENYLFEYRLCKGSIRQLRCLVPKCKSTAQQTILKCGVYEDKVIVKTPHNHPVPSEDERKKQIFLHLIRRRMQSDKSLNFRGVYDEFCEKDPEIKRLVPLKTVINQICCQQMNQKSPPISSFKHFFDLIESDELQKLHFTHSNSQFYQEKFEGGDGSRAVVFANCETIEKVSESKIMYVDASFKIDTSEDFKYHLVSVLVWLTDSYYPIMFALIDSKSQEIYKLIFSHLHDTLAPNLRPEEIVTDYEASLYYSLGEVFLDSHIGGSVFYYTQNLYKKICSLKLSRELETNSCFRNIYHMILMLPLLPVNTILDGLTNIEQQAVEMGQNDLVKPIFDHVRTQWISKVTPDLFCVHRLENRINENVIAPFKKLRDFIMLSKGKMQKQQINIISVVEKLIELEGFLSVVYAAPSKKSFARDLSSSQKKNVIRAWQFIETHPKIHINNFFTKVLGYIKCMENQLWIWGFYRYVGAADDELINAANFTVVNSNEEDEEYETQEFVNYVYPEGEVVVDIVVDQKEGFVVKQVVQGQGQVAGDAQEGFQTTFIE